MSFEALAYAKQMDLGDGNTSANHLLLRTIAEHTVNGTFQCTVSLEQLARETYNTTQHVRHLLTQLEERGAIVSQPTCSPPREHDKNSIKIVGFAEWYAAMCCKSIRQSGRSLRKAPFKMGICDNDKD